MLQLLGFIIDCPDPMALADFYSRVTGRALLQGSSEDVAVLIAKAKPSVSKNEPFPQDPQNNSVTRVYGTISPMSTVGYAFGPILPRSRRRHGEELSLAEFGGDYFTK